MRPASLIFLVLAVILAISGVITCNVAKSMAAKEGVELFYQTIDTENNSTYTYDMSADTVNKIVLNISDADINIIGNAKSNYIELINFNINTYGFTVSNNVLTVDDTLSLMSIFNFTEGGIEFKGLRHYLNTNAFASKPKTVNIYLTEASMVKMMNITLASGDLNISDITFNADYSINVSAGNVNVDGVTTESIMTIKVGEGNVTLTDSIAATFNAEITNGDFKYITPEKNFITAVFSTSLGKIYIDGADKGAVYNSASPMPKSKATVVISAGDIVMTDIS